ncbi:MAG: NAD(P)H-hydrate dehydratase [Candidatus Eisenbacteria bacterium]
MTAEEMRACDRFAIERAGVPGPTLMERAGIGIVRALRRHYPRLARRRVWIVCGRGNNGGDGLVVARLLHDSGANPRVLLTDPVASIAGDAALQVPPLLARRVALEPLTPERLAAIERLEPGDLLLDAVLGTGFRGRLEGPKAEAIAAMNRSPARRIAVDIPSGLSADSGAVDGEAFRAERTITMAYPKRSFLFWPARSHVGLWDVADIGIPREAEEAAGCRVRLLAAGYLRGRIARFEPQAHKGTRGRVLIAGGSPGLTGAPSLAAIGALRAGAGLVRAGVPRSLNPILEAKLTEAMTFPLQETDTGTLASSNLLFLISLRDRWDALVLGPGLARHADTDALVVELLAGWLGPIVVDADGLNAIASAGLDPLRPALRAADRVTPVFTPHPGEMERLTGASIPEILSDPIAAASRLAAEARVIVVLKTVPAIVASPDGRVLVNTSGNPGMATGGSGDVLSGILGALLAQGLSPFEAAACAVYAHGAAADFAVARAGERGALPGEVPDHLADVWNGIDTAD